MVLAVLRHELQACRSSGVPFSVAWPGAQRAALAGAEDAYERGLWRAALNATADSWEAAFDDQPVSAFARAAATLQVAA